MILDLKILDQILIHYWSFLLVRVYACARVCVCSFLYACTFFFIFSCEIPEKGPDVPRGFFEFAREAAVRNTKIMTTVRVRAERG